MASNVPEDATTALPSTVQQAPPAILYHQTPVPNGSINLQQTATTVIPSAGKARLQCHACQRLLEYDAGAQYVQCFSCSTMNAVQPSTQVGGQVLSMLCAICHTTNLAPYGINYVRCGSCSTISQVSHAYRQDRLISPPPPQSQAGLHQHSQSNSAKQSPPSSGMQPQLQPPLEQQLLSPPPEMVIPTPTPNQQGCPPQTTCTQAGVVEQGPEITSASNANYDDTQNS